MARKPYRRVPSGFRFTRRELRDLFLAWLALGVAFALFLDRRALLAAVRSPGTEAAVVVLTSLARALITVGIGFLLHELAHKAVAVRFDQIAEFRADYNMLGLAIVAGFAGFLYAAPGAVYHQGRITDRENGLIAIAGPLTNVALAAVFFPLTALPGFLGSVGTLGVLVNVLLAAFNMIPFGPLDGRKVLAWSTLVYVAVAVPTVGIAVWLLFL
ncbi:MAG: metalloprotease [Halobacteriales archaeon]